MGNLFTLFLLLVFLAATLSGWTWPYIAKLMPVYVVAIPGLVLATIQLARDTTGKRSASEPDPAGMDMDEVYNVTLEKKVELRRTLIYFAWFIGGAIGIWLLGIVIALPLLAALYTRIEGKEGWISSLIMGGVTYLLIWGLFEYMLESRWPSGLLFS